ncbi:MAG: glycosyltransferase family 2 protein [Pseudomonadota bacterium]
MKPFAAYSRRYERKRRLITAGLRAFDLKRHSLNVGAITKGDILLFATIRNEASRLPFFLEYYRARGVNHFLIVDNGSDDGSVELLERMADVSLWTTTGSYRRANFGVHWINALAHRYANGHWMLCVDPDEYLVYPHCDTRDIRTLTEHLEGQGRRSLGTLLLDLYGKGPIAKTYCAPDENPIEVAPWFDTANYFIRRNDRYRNLWIQGGPRLRAFFADRPMHAPALNKIPLVHWRRGDCYVSSTHALLPRQLNVTYDEAMGERLTGVLLHAKVLAALAPKVHEEMERAEHFAGGREYQAYAARIDAGDTLWSPFSAEYRDWRQLVALGLMSRGGWL